MSLWYYQDSHGLQVGPVADDAFHDLRESGTVRDTTLVWRTGWSDWTTFADIWIRGGPPMAQAPGDTPPLATGANVSQVSTQTLTEPAKTVVRITPEDEEKQTPPPLRLSEPIKEEELVEIKYATCSICQQQWPEHLLFGARRLFVCAPCLKAHEEKRKNRQRMRARTSGVNSGVISWVYKIMLLGLAIAGVVIVFFLFLKGVSK